MGDPQFPPRPTLLAQELIRPFIREGDLVIDATCGNGHDTLFLAECVGASGKVLAFDVQEIAIASTKALLERSGLANRVEFYQESHASISDRVQAGSTTVVMFNLGYLPGADKEQTTRADETLTALAAASISLKPGGILSVVCYPGHDAGADESAAVENEFAALARAGWRAAKYGMLGTLRPAPFLLLGWKSGSVLSGVNRASD